MDSQTLREGKTLEPKGLETSTTVEDKEDRVRQMELAGLNTQAEHSAWRDAMRDWGISLQYRYKTTAETRDFRKAIDIANAVLDSSSAVDPDDVDWLHQLIKLLIGELRGAPDGPDPAVVRKTIRFTEHCVAIAERRNSDEFYFRRILAELRITQWEQTSNSEILNLAIEDYEGARRVMPTKYQEANHILFPLQSLYAERLKATSNAKDIELIVGLRRELLNISPIKNSDRSCALHDLSRDLHRQYDLSNKDVSILDQAVIQMEASVTATPPHHHHWINHLVFYGQILQSRFNETGQLEDINKAIEIAERVLDATPEGDGERWNRLHQLGERLGERFGQTGFLPDLDRAIEEIMRSIDVTPPDDPDRSGPLNCLAIWLGRRFGLQGSAEDLTVALEKARLAVKITSTAGGHHRYGMNCNTLSNLLGEQFARTRDMQVLDEAIDIAEAALGECDEDSPERPCRLHGLSEHLATHHQHYGSRESLEKAIEKAKNSVRSTPDAHLHLPAHLDGYAKLLERKFIQDGVQADLDEAIESSRRAVTQVPSDHFDSAEVIVTLGKLLKRRYELLNIPKDYDESILSFQRGWDCPNASPSVRIQAASHAAELLAAEFNWEECSLLLQKAVELLPMVSPRSLDHVDKQHALSEFSGLASRAAASVLKHKNCPYDALRLLELGRNMIAGQILELRTDILDLEKLDKELAEKFVNLRDELDAATINRVDESGHAPFNWEAHNQRRRQADHELQQVIKNIRAYPEFTNFLLPPTAQEIQNAASQGPIVVVNTSPFRCDAFIIQHHRIQLLELDRLTLEDVNVHVRRLNLGDLQPVLKWSWDAIAKPILTKLGLIQPVLDGNWSRLWWILTGPLCHLPIHGAGYHYQEDRDTVLDRVISSYASSIKAILYDRKHRLRHAAGCTKGKALLVPMPDTPGNSPLMSTTTEIREVELHCPALNLEPIRPTTVCKDDVLNDLRSCETFHFAGHGISDSSEPSKSTLCLLDWKSNPLTVGDLRELKLQASAPWLGYLSACSTSQVRAEKLVDEAIHLASACQLAGFRHVIGTLWEVSDECCVDAAKLFYMYLSEREITDYAVARALHLTILQVRNRSTALTEPRIGKVLTALDPTSMHDMARAEDTGMCVTESQELENKNATSSMRVGTRRKTESHAGSLNWVPYIHFGI